MTDLQQLAKPFPRKMIHSNPSGGGTYVKHHGYTQRLLLYTGPYDFELVEVIRGDVAEKPPNPKGKSERARNGAPALSNVIVGVVMRLTVTVDGKVNRTEDVGDCEEPHNWPHDGARLKDACSDALKRCARHLGLGLHLYAQEEYVLSDALQVQADHPGDMGGADDVPPEDPEPQPSPEPESEPQTPAQPDWSALGWKDQADHDATKAAVKADAGALSDESKEALRAWASETGLVRTVMSAEDVAEWDRQVKALAAGD